MPVYGSCGYQVWEEHMAEYCGHNPDGQYIRASVI